MVFNRVAVRAPRTHYARYSRNEPISVSNNNNNNVYERFTVTDDESAVAALRSKHSAGDYKKYNKYVVCYVAVW